MSKRKLICPICGRVFHEGQGVTIDFAGRPLIFHSKTCALKFIRLMITYIEPTTLRKAVDDTLKELNERLETIRKMKEKKLA